jgi:hypothetical protein
MKAGSGILAIAVVAAVGVGFHFWREAESGRKQIADLKAELLQLQIHQARAVQSASSTVAPVVPVVPGAPAAQPATPAAPVSPETAAVPARPTVLPDLTAIRAQMSSPEATAQRVHLSRLLIERSNPYVQEALGLAADESRKLLDLLATHQERSSTAFSSSAGNGAATAQERMAAVQAQQQANEAELQAMLGSKYPQWQGYKETRNAWQQLRDLNAVADAGGTPLSDSQSRNLTAALLAEQRDFNQQARSAASQGRSFTETLTRHTAARQQQLLNIASAHLSPQQLEGYRGMLERAAAQEQAMLRSVQANQPAATAPAVP